MTQVFAIMAVLGLALGVLFLAWFSLAACQLSSEISRHEERLARGDYQADETEHDDG